MRMSDFDFDAMQKKRIARGAAHMKRGSKSRKCSLPSDYLTPAQLKRRNGPVETYNLNAPMTWEQFKTMPADLQQRYIDNLQSRFNLSVSRISEDLFHMSGANLIIYSKRTGLKYSVERKGSRLTAEEKAAWRQWLNGENAVQEETPEMVRHPDEMFSPAPVGQEPYDNVECGEVDSADDVESEPAELNTDELLTQRFAMKETWDFGLDELSAVFTGNFDPEVFLHWITKLPMPDGNVHIKVEVARV